VEKTKTCLNEINRITPGQPLLVPLTDKRYPIHLWVMVKLRTPQGMNLRLRKS